MIRLFIALKIPGEIKEQIISLRKSAYNGPEKFRWENPDKLHLTLKFIGDVQEQITGDIVNSISFIENYNRFNCAFTGFGFFFNNGLPKILWAGLKTDQKPAELAEKLNNIFSVHFSVPAEHRKFKPHLTLLRIKDKVDSKFIDSFTNFRTEAIPFIAHEIALIKSELSPSGSVYTELKNFNLK
jgi:2'-5' RNA ligase